MPWSQGHRIITAQLVQAGPARMITDALLVSHDVAGGRTTSNGFFSTVDLERLMTNLVADKAVSFPVHLSPSALYRWRKIRLFSFPFREIISPKCGQCRPVQPSTGRPDATSRLPPEYPSDDRSVPFRSQDLRQRAPVPRVPPMIRLWGLPGSITMFEDRRGGRRKRDGRGEIMLRGSAKIIFISRPRAKTVSSRRNGPFVVRESQPAPTGSAMCGKGIGQPMKNGGPNRNRPFGSRPRSRASSKAVTSTGLQPERFTLSKCLCGRM